MENMPIAVTVNTTNSENIINTSEAQEKCENTIRPTLDNIGNDEMMKQSFQWPPSKTYRSPQLDFQMTLEEDVMEWIQIEPPICTQISAQTNKNENEKINEDRIEKSKNKRIRNEDNDLQIIINSLNKENIRLRRKVKTLQLRLQRYIRRMPKKRNNTNKKNNKKIIQELMDKNKLHPVAKTLINLQLHTPNAPYMEEEKNISKQLYYYSASALRGLRKAGCNFPGERTIQRWHEEYNMMPGFCKFIFC